MLNCGLGRPGKSLDRLVADVDRRVSFWLSSQLELLFLSKMDPLCTMGFYFPNMLGKWCIISLKSISICSCMNGVIIIVGGEIKKSCIKKPRCVDSTEGTISQCGESSSFICLSWENHGLQSFPQDLAQLQVLEPSEIGS